MGSECGGIEGDWSERGPALAGVWEQIYTDNPNAGTVAGDGKSSRRKMLGPLSGRVQQLINYEAETEEFTYVQRARSYVALGLQAELRTTVEAQPDGQSWSVAFDTFGWSLLGGRLPLHATGVGLVLLAHAPPALQEQVLATPLRRYTARTLCSAAALRRVLADVRRTGVAVSDGQIELVALSVAAPVRGPRGDVVAALSVVVPAATSDARAYVPVVRAAARGVSRTLGAAT